LDEPTAGLSPKAAAMILNAVRRAQEQMGFACLLVEHNLRLVSDWVDRALIMQQGRIVGEVTDREKLRDRQYLEKHYF
jgi:energy-coupling factor transporter ATP-binding protein EcfA2